MFSTPLASEPFLGLQPLHRILIAPKVRLSWYRLLPAEAEFVLSGADPQTAQIATRSVDLERDRVCRGCAGIAWQAERLACTDGSKFTLKYRLG